jgi:hypothetical protein
LKGGDWGKITRDEVEDEHTASPVSPLDPSSPSPSLFASPLLPRSDLQSHSYQRPNTFNIMPATEQEEEAKKKTTNLVLNSSGTSTDTGPSAFDDLARRRGFPSCAVRDGRET